MSRSFSSGIRKEKEWESAWFVRQICTADFFETSICVDHHISITESRVEIQQYDACVGYTKKRFRQKICAKLMLRFGAFIESLDRFPILRQDVRGIER